MTLLYPKSEAIPDTWQIKDAFRAAAKRQLAGKDVTSMTPEVTAALDAAYAETQALLGKAPDAAFKESVYQEMFEDAQRQARHAQREKSGKEELADCSPESIM